MSNGKVDFLMEIMKSKTTTRQQPSQEWNEIAVEPLCADCGVGDYDSEVREQPPQPSPTRRATAFDFYGNPISERDQMMQKLLQQQLQYQAQAAAAASTAPVRAPTMQSEIDDYSEFLFAQTDLPNIYQKDLVEVDERGCIAEFGHCMQVSLCCAGDQDLVDAVVDTVVETAGESPRMQDHHMMREINAELHALRMSTMDAKTSKAVLEFELRAELAEIRRQTAEMEESYRREIARKLSEKVLIQAQLQNKLLSIMEARVFAEIQLDGLNGNGLPQLTQGTSSSSATFDGIPTVTGTPVHSNSLAIVPVQPSMSPGQPTDPPIEKRVPVDPSARTLACTPKSFQARTPEAPYMPFGLSIITERPNDYSNNGCSETRKATSADPASPTAHRSFSPNSTHSPPASNRSCEPEGSSYDDMKAEATPSSSRSPAAYNSLPLPVASPVRGFVDPE